MKSVPQLVTDLRCPKCCVGKYDLTTLLISGKGGNRGPLHTSFNFETQSIITLNTDKKTEIQRAK